MRQISEIGQFVPGTFLSNSYSTLLVISVVPIRLDGIDYVMVTWLSTRMTFGLLKPCISSERFCASEALGRQWSLAVLPCT
jgi:hypothetical protein